MDGWVLKLLLDKRFGNQTVVWVNGWMDGWMDGWVDGWVIVNAILRIAYSNKKETGISAVCIQQSAKET